MGIKGPAATVLLSCENCDYQHNERAMLKDKMKRHCYCVHPQFAYRRFVGDWPAGTPSWCPYLVPLEKRKSPHGNE